MSDLLDLAPFVAGREHALFGRLREQAPAHNPEPDGPGFWSLTRYEHVAAAARDHSRFRSGSGTQIRDKRAEGHGHPSVHNADPPLHGRLRALVLPSLARSRVERLTPLIATIAARLLAETPRDGPWDFVEGVAVPLPMMVIAAVLGVPDGDQRQLVGWANLMSDVRADDSVQADARANLFDYFRVLVAAKRRDPADDLASALAAAELDGATLPADALDAYFMLLTVAGNETTRFLLTGGLAELLRDEAAGGGQLDRLRGDPGLIPTAVEELCRWVSPVAHMRRTTSAATDLWGTAVPAGAKVVLWFASANRDERVFADPDRIDVGRAVNPHLGFGLGAHFCVGAHLARLEAQLFLTALLADGRRLRLLAEPERLPSNWFTGWTRMPVEWA